MHHFIFAAHGTWGDVGPLAALATRLTDQGARVTFISTPFFQSGLQARGLHPVIPFGADQYDNANHIQRLGLGLPLPRRQATAPRIAARLRRLLTPDPERDAHAQRIAQTLRQATPGLDVAAREVLATPPAP